MDLSTSSFFPPFKKIRFSFLNFLSILPFFLSFSLNKEKCWCFWKENVLTERCLFLVISFVREWCCYICCRQWNRSKVQFLFLFLFPQTQHNSESFKTFFFSLSFFLLQNSREMWYLMESAPYGFRGDIGGANQEYVRFKSNYTEEPISCTITINFDTKEFLLETDEEKRFYKVDLIDLHKHWPLRVGICGHLTTTIEMVCFFLSPKVISTVILNEWMNEISF